MTLTKLTLALFLTALATSANAQVRVFHSPGDDGTGPAGIAVLSPGTNTLHLYMESGTNPSPSAPCNIGGGDEVCQWLIDARGADGVSFQSFSPVGDVGWDLKAQTLSATGGDHEFGQLGAFKLGDLVIDSQGSGSVALARAEIAASDLALALIAGDYISATDLDTDGTTDVADNCSAVGNASQLDTDSDQFGNACDCDFDNDGTCGIQDFNLFLPDFTAGSDSGVGTDQNGDGTVGIADFNLFLPGFMAGGPGPSGLVP